MIKLPNGQPLMTTDEAGLKHEYDPAYARAYYLRTRKLKGRDRAAAVKAAPKNANQATYRKKLDNFLKKLPMAVEGADLKATEAFVDRMRTMSDSQMRAEAAKIRKEKGDNDGAQVATIEALLKNRERVRKNKTAKAKPKPKPKSKARPKMAAVGLADKLSTLGKLQQS